MDPSLRLITIISVASSLRQWGCGSFRSSLHLSRYAWLNKSSDIANCWYGGGHQTIWSVWTPCLGLAFLVSLHVFKSRGECQVEMILADLWFTYYADRWYSQEWGFGFSVDCWKGGQGERRRSLNSSRTLNWSKNVMKWMMIKWKLIMIIWY